MKRLSFSFVVALVVLIGLTTIGLGDSPATAGTTGQTVGLTPPRIENFNIIQSHDGTVLVRFDYMNINGGLPSALFDISYEVLRRNKVVYKGPPMTPELLDLPAVKNFVYYNGNASDGVFLATLPATAVYHGARTWRWGDTIQFHLTLMNGRWRTNTLTATITPRPPIDDNG